MHFRSGLARKPTYTRPMNEEKHESMPAKNIVLVGFMGSGKSTIGREIGKLLGYPLIDTDTKIEESESLSVSDIFSLKGEPHFRACETQTVRDLIKEGLTHHIIATGGGLPVTEVNRPLLRSLGYVVWLDADTDTILERTSRNDARPLLQTENPKATIDSMLAVRNSVYQEVSHLHLQTTDLSISETAHGIIESARYFFGHA